MTWENHTTHGWHIDHVKPCAVFDLSKPEEQKKCFHYTNLQPLWAKENLSKSGSWNAHIAKTGRYIKMPVRNGISRNVKS